MRRIRFDRRLVVILCALVAFALSACGSVIPANPTAPTEQGVPSVKTTFSWSEVRHVNDEAKQYLIAENLNRRYPPWAPDTGVVKSWDRVGLTIYFDPGFSSADAQAVINFWEANTIGKLSLVSSENEANI